jgi:mycothiol synthase
MAESSPATLSVTDDPAPTEQQQVIALVRRAAVVDGHHAVNEAGLLALQRGRTARSSGDGPTGEAPRHVLAHDAATGDLVGYAQAIREGAGPVAALVVDPDHRRRGIGAALWRRLTDETTEPLRVWASGDTPAARALAATEGLRPVRTLQVLGRSLRTALPPTDPPDGITIRTFRPGFDDAEWLAVNARAFAGHPEQGSLTLTDLQQRMAEPWFDPAGFFVAVRQRPEQAGSGADAGGQGPQIVGFHWTKREPGSATGEVYVIGVDPTAGVRGLGAPLLGTGLRHLRDIGAREVDLYVEADNTRALALYRRYGFSLVTADVMYAAPARPAETSG